MNKWGVGFIPSYNNGSGKSPAFSFLTDIDPFLCPLNDKFKINGLEYVMDEKGFSHPLGPFIEAINLAQEDVPFDTVDCRTKVFESRKDAIKHINGVMDKWF